MISKSYPFLSIARKNKLDYGDVLLTADYLQKMLRSHPHKAPGWSVAECNAYNFMTWLSPVLVDEIFQQVRLWLKQQDGKAPTI